jgi:dihydroneopterin aldolase
MIKAILKLHTIRAFTHIGYFDTERATGQWIELAVDLEMKDPMSSDGDDISSTIDYGYLTGKLTTFLEESQAKLIEKLAIDVAREVFRLDVYSKVSALHIRIKKTSPSPNYDGHAVYELLADRASL